MRFEHDSANPTRPAQPLVTGPGRVGLSQPEESRGEYIAATWNWSGSRGKWPELQG